MIDTKELADMLLSIGRASYPEAAAHTVKVLDEALAPLLAELGRVRAENEELGRHLEAVDLRALEVTLRTDQDARHRISDREREVEVEDLAKQLFITHFWDAKAEKWFETAEAYIRERDRRRAERKETGNG